MSIFHNPKMGFENVMEYRLAKTSTLLSKKDACITFKLSCKSNKKTSPCLGPRRGLFSPKEVSYKNCSLFFVCWVKYSYVKFNLLDVCKLTGVALENGLEVCKIIVSMKNIGLKLMGLVVSTATTVFNACLKKQFRTL